MSFNTQKSLWLDKNIEYITLCYLIKIKFHEGSWNSNEIMKKKMNYYIEAKENKKEFYYKLTKIVRLINYLTNMLKLMFIERHTFFVVGLRENRALEVLVEDFHSDFLLNTGQFITIDSGIYEGWIKGLLTNWLIIYDLLRNSNELIKKKNNNRLKKFYNVFLQLKYKKKYPLLSDFIIFLNGNKDILTEVVSVKLPMIGLNNNEIDPSFYLCNLIGNNKSILCIDFFLAILKHTLYLGRLHEQKIFYLMIFAKIKHLLLYK